MSAREEIFAALRRNGARDTPDPAARQAVEDRIQAHEAGIIPERAEGDRAARIARFTERAEAVDAVVSWAVSPAVVPGIIAQYLADQNLPARVILSPDPLLTDLPWDTVPMIERRVGVPGINDMVSLSAPLAGIAETGSILLCSGADNAHIASFLPETNIAILPTDRLVGSMEQAWKPLRALDSGPKGVLPRAVTLVTGPSRTGDIEQRIELGAHGPRRLHIVLVDDETE